MALSHDYTLLCEFARLEFGGKYTIIGLFPNGIGTPQIPFPLPSLTFFSALRADTAGAYKFTGKLATLATGEVLARAQGVLQTTAPGPVVFPITLPNVRFNGFGSYVWSLEIGGQDEPFVMEFPVAHVPLQVMMPPAPPPGWMKP